MGKGRILICRIGSSDYYIFLKVEFKIVIISYKSLGNKNVYKVYS